VVNPLLYAGGGLILILAAGGAWQTIKLERCQRQAAETAEQHALALVAAQAQAQTRDVQSEGVADAVRTEATEAVAVVQTTTAGAVERVRTVIREVAIPQECPASLPAGVNDEGRAAVARANQR